MDLLRSAHLQASIAVTTLRPCSEQLLIQRPHLRLKVVYNELTGRRRELYQIEVEYFREFVSSINTAMADWLLEGDSAHNNP
jgi:hypothetical protein